MIKNKYFKTNLIKAQSGITFTLDNNQVTAKVTGDIEAGTTLTVSFCSLGPYSNGVCSKGTETTSNPVSLSADCSALYPATSPTITSPGYSVTTDSAGNTVNTKSVYANVGNLFNKCNGVQPTAVATSTNTNPLTCTFNSDSS